MRSDDDRGMVTAELAVCLPVLMLLLAAALSLVEVGAAQIRALDAAREAARASARGDTAAAEDLARDAAPGVDVRLQSTATEVTATAILHVALIGGLLPGVTVSESEVAALEPSAPP